MTVKMSEKQLLKRTNALTYCYNLEYRQQDFCKKDTSEELVIKWGFRQTKELRLRKSSFRLCFLNRGVYADISNVICAGITETDVTAVKGEVKVYETSIKYSAKECSILDFSQDAVDILSSKAQNVDVIFVAYDENGKLVSSHKENVALQQGKNKLDVSGIDFTNSDSIQLWYGIDMISMRPLADKATINK